jgi:hypothetical protein
MTILQIFTLFAVFLYAAFVWLMIQLGSGNDA